MKAKKVLNFIQENILDGIDDEIGIFWVVTTARPESELVDILFKTNLAMMMIRARGGLNPNEVLATFKDPNKARKYAENYLAKYKKTNK